MNDNRIDCHLEFSFIEIEVVIHRREWVCSLSSNHSVEDNGFAANPLTTQSKGQHQRWSSTQCQLTEKADAQKETGVVYLPTYRMCQKNKVHSTKGSSAYKYGTKRSKRRKVFNATSKSFVQSNAI